jgi:moderate conductance mechanosensitive channel
MFKLRIKSWILNFLMVFVITTGIIITPSYGQLIPSLHLPTSPLIPETKSVITSACIYLDGRCIFELSTLDNESFARIYEIQSRLDDISKRYLRDEITNLDIRQEIEGSLPNIYIQIEKQEAIRLFTVTNPDAQLTGVPLEAKAQQLIDILKSSLQDAKKERTVEFLGKQAGISFGILLIVAFINFLTKKRIKFLKKNQQNLENLNIKNADSDQVISALLIERKNWNFKEVQVRLLQLLQTGLIGGGLIFILGLFPYTRMTQLFAIVLLQYPLRLGIVVLFTYLLIRLSYGLIAQFNSVIAANNLITPKGDQRLKLRITTISVVVRSIVTATWITVGILVGLAVININITPLLAGAGIIGLAISFASQNLIKDAINGFCIIFEDQYAVGDVINVGSYGGLVEYMNLRITQIRDSEGRLITIPNSEVRIVANLSSHWSRADLTIPVAYNADIDKF